MIVFPLCAVPLHGTTWVKYQNGGEKKLAAMFVDSDGEIWVLKNGGSMLEQLSDADRIVIDWSLDK